MSYFQPVFFLSSSDLVVLWRDLFKVLAWIVLIIYVLSGIQDFVYDLWSYAWRVLKKRRFKGRKRISLERMRLREQQMIAVFIPAWKEAGVIDKMVENILEKVEYSKYIVFVGTYPNDMETQDAVDKLSVAYPQVVKVVTSRPGPTNKADCLNHIYKALKEYEIKHTVFFEMIVMHDAEDFVHRYSFLLYNFLIPRVDAVQLPILPLPTRLFNWVHWSYADEFAENHMKDIIVRERMKGFVPYAGVGTGFSRRLFNYLDRIKEGEVFNEGSLTEDYSTAKSARDAGMNSIFVNVVLDDDKAPWYRPLCRREFFISNWSYFPSDFRRSIRQKTRWIVGISFQEWEHSKWKGSLAIKENFLKDRKGIFAFSANLLGYIILLYVLVSLAGARGLLPFMWEPIFYRGTLLFYLIVAATFFMSVRIIQRIILVTAIYGIIPGILSIPRLFVGNVINGLASFRALGIYLKTISEPVLKWDKTEHSEGAGINPFYSVEGTVSGRSITCAEFIDFLQKENVPEILEALENLKHECSPAEHEQMMEIMNNLAMSDNLNIRVLTSKMFSKFKCKHLFPFAMKLLFDKEWVVRANAAKALVQSGFILEMLKELANANDKFAKDVVIKTLEQNEWAFYRIIPELNKEEFEGVRNMLLSESGYLSEKYSLKTEVSS